MMAIPWTSDLRAKPKTCWSCDASNTDNDLRSSASAGIQYPMSVGNAMSTRSPMHSALERMVLPKRACGLTMWGHLVGGGAKSTEKSPRAPTGHSTAGRSGWFAGRWRSGRRLKSRRARDGTKTHSQSSLTQRSIDVQLRLCPSARNVVTSTGVSFDCNVFLASSGGRLQKYQRFEPTWVTSPLLLEPNGGRDGAVELCRSSLPFEQMGGVKCLPSGGAKGCRARPVLGLSPSQ